MVVIFVEKNKFPIFVKNVRLLFDLCEFKNRKLLLLMIWVENKIEAESTYVHSYSFHRSMHSNGSGHMTFEHGLFDGQLRSKFRAIVACPHWVPFIAGGNGRCFPSNLFGGQSQN